jgi:hypothetical protein
VGGRLGGRPVPGQKIGQPFGRIIGDAREHVMQIGLGIEAVQLGRLDQGIEDGRALGPEVGAGEQVVLAPERHAAQRPFGGVVFDRDAPIVEG